MMYYFSFVFFTHRNKKYLYIIILINDLLSLLSLKGMIYLFINHFMLQIIHLPILCQLSSITKIFRGAKIKK